MAIKPDWTLGTLTLTAGSTAFTTTGSALKAADIQGGDTLMTQSGAVLVIETITGENSGTLYMPCPASVAGYDQPLRVRYQADGSRLPAATRDLVNMLSSGNVAAFAELVGQADMVPIFTGTGMLTLVSTELVGGGGVGSWAATVALPSGRDAFNDKPAGFRVLVIDNGTGRSAVYEKTSTGAGDWSEPIYFTGHQGVPGIAGVEYGVTIKSETGIGLAHIGEYPASRSTRSSGRITRFYGEVVGVGSIVVQVTLNGKPIADPWTIAAPTPLRVENLQILVAFGDAISFSILGFIGAPKMAWLQLD